MPVRLKVIRQGHRGVAAGPQPGAGRSGQGHGTYCLPGLRRHMARDPFRADDWGNGCRL